MKSYLSFDRSQSPRPGKQVYELTLDDLSAYPIWEFRLDYESEEKQNESTVRPHRASGPLNPTDRMFVVRAIFTLADGSKMTGYLTPPARDQAGVDTLQPIIVTDRGQVRFWCGTTAPDARRMARGYELLGRDATNVFPLRFESDVELAGGPARGSVPGFLVLEDFQTWTTRAVT
jgi:hypothetical protein